MIINFCFFVVSIKAVSNLKEMGFQEDEIVMALKATVNNQEAAVSYSCHYFIVRDFSWCQNQAKELRKMECFCQGVWST